jgi:formate/nitrite transporter FocA (FNT family)
MSTDTLRAREEERKHAPPAGSDAKQAEEEKSVDAPTTHEIIRRKGEKELERPASGLAWSGLAAGLAMGLTLVAEGALRSHLPDAPWRPLVTKLGYSIGFLAVILGSQQLYTENTLTPIVPYMTRRTGEMARKVLMLWGVVLLANLVGAFLFAWAAAATEAFKPELRAAFTEIGWEALEGSFGAKFAGAIVAGWIIALMVWMVPAAQTAQVAVIAVMAWLVGVGGFAHIIVGSVETLFLVMTGALPFGDYVTRFMLPALLGNTLGGVVLVALINHRQVAAGH